MKYINTYTIALSLAFSPLALNLMAETGQDERVNILLDDNWRFSRNDSPNFTKPDFDDKKWQEVTIPHDWAIYGPFSIDNDPQYMAISQDGQKKALAHTGRTGGLPFVGVGWYRLDFDAPTFEDGRKATLVFDGAMSQARVYINGKEAGFWPYGYNSFHVDATPFLNKDGEDNTLAVRLENPTESSRWYPGSGLYRNVHLVITDDIRIPIWGTHITTPKVTDKFAKVNLRTKVEGNKPGQKIELETVILDPKNKAVASQKQTLTAYNENCFDQTIIVDNPMLWDLEQPNLYKAISKVFVNGKEVDEYESTFGIRTIEIIPNQGFFLNGKMIKFQGVCNHHDLGPLGGIANEAGIRRQVRIMKDMGANALRTSHNMPAPELIKACDEMGMMVMPETFDEWKVPKMKNGYNRYFDEWAEKDLINLIHQFRNSPSVVMWCIGNEVPEQWHGGNGAKRAKFLQDICHREDPTRPVTNGMDAPDAVVKNGMAAILDVAGFNYRPHKYQESYKILPQQIILGSETASTISSRGVYKFPVERKSMAKYDDHQSSSYDVEHCGWSNLPEDDFIQHTDLPYAIGEFVWTGFDYLGEPTPYYTNWPSHSSLFGIVDLAGIPKDRYYLYRSHWNADEETLHILPHWNWEGREGEVTPVFVYTNYPTAELFINGKSQGKRTKDQSVTVHNSTDSTSIADFKRQKRFRLMWMDTKYEKGEVKVVAYDENGKQMAEKVIRTASEPYTFRLTADRQTIKADGKDLSFVTVEIVDKAGNLCPNAQTDLSFKVKGEGSYRAGANGDPTNLQQFHLPKMKAFNGMMTAIVESTDNAGEIILEVRGKGLKTATIKIKTTDL